MTTAARSALLLGNAVLGLTSSGFAATAAARPAAMSHSTQPSVGERFYSRMYAARGVPLGVLAAVAPLVVPGPAAALCLIGAAVAQIGDAAIGASRRDPRMVAGSGIVTVVHIAAAVVIW